MRWAVGVIVAGIVASSAVVSPSQAEPAATGLLSWRPCQTQGLDGYECAALTVPRDWDDPHGPTITVQMARHRSMGSAKERIGSLFFNPGGPGGSGLDVLPGLWPNLPEEIQRRFDLVTWDPRGMGASTAIDDCGEVSFQLPVTGPVDWAEIAETVRTRTADVNAACQAANADLAPFIGTNQVVRDLDAMRAAVGDRRLTYWGASYGSRIGYAYGLRYPGRVRAILLDGSVNPRGSMTDLIEAYSTAADSGLGFLFDLYPRAARDYRRALAGLERQPVTLPNGDLFTRWDLKVLLAAFAGREGTGDGSYEQLARMLTTIVTGVTGSGRTAARARKEMMAIPHGPDQFTISGAPAMVNCLDYPDRPTAADQAEFVDEAVREAPIAGWFGSLGLAAQCEGLGLAPDPVPTDFGANWSIPFLILGATRDTNTPYVWTVDMARAFRASRVVTYVGSKHISFVAAQSRCIDDLVSAYLVQRRLPRIDVACQNAAA